MWEQVWFLVKVFCFFSFALWPLIVLAFTLPTSKKAAKTPCRRVAELMMQESLELQAHHNGPCAGRLSHVDSASVSMWLNKRCHISYLSNEALWLIWRCRRSFHWINASICLLFCSVLTYSFIHNEMCTVVSGCLVIVIQLETEHVLNKQKLVRLILFSFFQARRSLPIQLWNMNTKWLCDAPYHGFWADTMSPIIMALH